MINTYKKEKETFIKSVRTYNQSYNSEDYDIKEVENFGGVYYNIYKKAKTVLTDVQINEKDIYKIIKLDDKYAYVYIREDFNIYYICLVISLFILFFPIALIVSLFNRKTKYLVRLEDLERK